MWAELDLAAGTWLIPANRMKYKGKPHLVSLSSYAVKLFTDWKSHQRGRPRYVFPVQGRKNDHVLADNLVERFKRLGVDGFSPKVCRATFRTGMQALGCPKEVRSHMSHHQPGDKASRSYDKHDYAPEAKQWWEQWGIHLSRLDRGKPGLAKVVAIGAKHESK